MKPKLLIIVYLLISSNLLVGQNKINNSKVYQVDIDKVFSKVPVDPMGSPIVSAKSIAFSNDGYLNTLDQLVGRVISIKVDEKGQIIDHYLFEQIIKTGDTLKVSPTDLGDAIDEYVKKERAFTLSFMGVSADITNDQTYEYKSVPVLLCNIRDHQIDKNKIPNYAKCPDPYNCEYYYISSALVRLSETTLYSKKGNKLKLADLASFGVAKPIEGSIYVGSEQRNHVKKYVIFCNLQRIPK